MEISSSNSYPNQSDSHLVTILSRLNSVESEDEIRYLKTKIYNRLSEEFYDRLHKVAGKRFSGIPEIEEVRKDVFQETFQIALEKIKDFKTKESWTDQECEKVLLSWLGKIANVLLIGRSKSEAEKRKELEGYQYFVESENSEGATGKRIYKPTYDREKLKKVLDSLSPMSKEILDACIAHNTLAEGDAINTKHLPYRVLDQLKSKYDVTSGAIRKAKERLLKAIKSCKL